MSFGLIGGVLALTALDAVVTSKGATDNVTGILGAAASFVRRLADPSIPAIPDHRAKAGAATSAAPAPSTTHPRTVPTRYGATRTHTKTGSVSTLFT